MIEQMDVLINKFPDQVDEALALARDIKLKNLRIDHHNIVLVGMGGSGIGANFVQSLIADQCPIPITINKDYTIPRFVNEKTLAIVSSYSGNTEETLSAFKELQDAKAEIVCISSGGKLKKESLDLGYNFIEVPGGWPAPRACLGYSMVLQLAVLSSAGYCDEKIIDDLRTANHELILHQKEIKERASEISERILHKDIIIYSEQKLEPIAVRLRQQFNENTKILCSHHVIPELNHNELVGWSEKRDNTSVLMIRDHLENKRNAARIDITKGILSEMADEVIELRGEGEDYISRLFYLIHLGDWISFYLADKRGVDAMEINAINYLKNKLSELS